MRDKDYVWPHYQFIIAMTSLHQDFQPLGTKLSILQPSMMLARPWPGILPRPRGSMQWLLIHPPNLVQDMLEPFMITIWNTITDMYDKGNHLRKWQRKFLAEMLYSRLQSKVRETLNNTVKAWVFLCWWWMRLTRPDRCGEEKSTIWAQLIEASAIANLTTIQRSGISRYATEVPDSYFENVCHSYLHLYYLVQTLLNVGTWSFWISLMCLSWLYQRHLNSWQRRMNPQKFLA